MDSCRVAQEAANLMFRPVGAKVGLFLYVEDFNPLTDRNDYGLFGLLDSFFQFTEPRKLTAGAEEGLKGTIQ